MLTLVNIVSWADIEEVSDMGAIPPGPQIPFDKDRSYGQESGIVSRNMGKVLILLVLAGIVAVGFFISALINQ